MVEEVTIKVDLLKRILDCVPHAVHLSPLVPATEDETTKVWEEGMTILTPILAENDLSESAYQQCQKKWNSDCKSGLLEKKIEISAMKPDGTYDKTDAVIKWGQLVAQEWVMYCNQGKQVDTKEFEWLCQRRGFDQSMRQYLIDILKHGGICENL